MKIKISTLFIMLCFSISHSQNDSLYSDHLYNPFEEISFKIAGGVLIPQGGLKKYFGTSPFVELSFNFPLKKRKMLEFAIQFVIPNQKSDFLYHRTMDTVRAKASFMFNPMVRFKKNLLKSDTNKLNLGLGLGASVINTDARNPFYEGEDDQKKYETITALLIAPSIDYTYHFSNEDEISIGFSVQYSPYKVEGALREDIGSLFYIPKVSYRF